MSGTQQKCVLVYSGSEDLLDIELADGKEVVLGRGPLTKIKDSRCSRSQLSVRANYKDRQVILKTIGRNNCGLNDRILSYEETVGANENDQIELLHGQYKYKVTFSEPAAVQTVNNTSVTNMVEENNKSDSEEEIPLAQRIKRARLEKPFDLAAYNIDPKKVLRVTITRLKDVPPTVKLKPPPGITINGSWKKLVKMGTCRMFTSHDVRSSSLIAAYDLDNTLIQTRSGNPCPINNDDWCLRYPRVSAKLKDLVAKGYKIVIFTNQGGVPEQFSVNDFQRKMEYVIYTLGVPVQLFAATGETHPSSYRKPLIGMWEAMLATNGGISVNMLKSFFCGDAAGRQKGLNLTKSDFAPTDFLFALNVGIPFITPEMHFEGVKTPAPRITTFDPRTIPVDIPLCDPPYSTIFSTECEIVVLVGSPGAGKTHFCRMHMIPAGYVHVSRDIVGRNQSCIDLIDKTLSAKPRRPVIVDNTNPTVSERYPFIALGKKYQVPVRCFVLNTSYSHASHNNKFRMLVDPKAAVNEMAIKRFRKIFVMPTVQEGFKEVIRINFWPTFLDSEHEKLYKLFLLER